ncbi:unnamed protein product, partial [Polarella glacialis]
VTNPKFVSGVSDKVGRRMMQAVKDSMDTFSDKQVITLMKCKLAELYQDLAAGADDEDDDEEEEEAPPSPRPPRSRSRSRRRHSSSLESARGSSPKSGAREAAGAISSTAGARSSTSRADAQSAAPGWESRSTPVAPTSTDLSSQEKVRVDLAFQDKLRKQ